MGQRTGRCSNPASNGSHQACGPHNGSKPGKLHSHSISDMKKPTDDPPRRYDTATDNECNQGITFTFLGRPDDHKKHGDKQQAGIDHRV